MQACGDFDFSLKSQNALGVTPQHGRARLGRKRSAALAKFLHRLAAGMAGIEVGACLLDIFAVGHSPGTDGLERLDQGQPHRRQLVIDPWWNAAAEQQAFCRVFRIGQKETTFMTRFCVKNTIDERLINMQKRKQEEIEQVINEEPIKEKM